MLGTALIILLYPQTANHQPVHCLFETISALGCVGLSTDLTSSDLPIAPKMLLCLLMWIGRLEIVPLFVAFAMLLPKRWNCG